MHKFNIKAETKKNLIVFSTFFGIIIAFTVLLVIFTLIARNSWKNGLAIEMQRVLDSYPEATYTVSRNLQLDSALSSNVAVYSLLKKDERKNQMYYGIIVRIPSLLGPLPAVFIYNENSGVSFVGYAIDNGKAEVIVEKQISSTIMNYWEDMIPKIIKKTSSY